MYKDVKHQEELIVQTYISLTHNTCVAMQRVRQVWNNLVNRQTKGAIALALYKDVKQKTQPSRMYILVYASHLVSYRVSFYEIQYQNVPPSCRCLLIVSYYFPQRRAYVIQDFHRKRVRNGPSITYITHNMSTQNFYFGLKIVMKLLDHILLVINCIQIKAYPTYFNTLLLFTIRYKYIYIFYRC